MIGAQVVSVPMALPIANANHAFVTFMGSLTAVFFVLSIACFGALGILSAGKVDVGVAKGHTGNVVAKNADGVDGADDGEDLEEVRLANILGKVADVERGGGRDRGAGEGTGSGSYSDRSRDGGSHCFF